MYIKFKDGTVLEVQSAHLNAIMSDVSWYTDGRLFRKPVAEIEFFADERPSLIGREKVEDIMKPYLHWSKSNEGSAEEDYAITSIHDLMEYLVYEKKILTPVGFKDIGPIIKYKPLMRKVQVVYSHILHDGTYAYKDKDGQEYYVPSMASRMVGVYRKFPGAEESWDDVRLWDVELEVIEQLPAPERAPMLHRDDRPGC